MAPLSWAVSALRTGVAASLMTTPSNGLLGSFSPGSWSRTRTILPRTSSASIIVVSAVRGYGCRSRRRPGRLAPSAAGAERQREEILAREETAVRAVYGEPQPVGRAKACRHEVEGVVIRPAGTDRLQADPLEPRSDELGGQARSQGSRSIGRGSRLPPGKTGPPSCQAGRSNRSRRGRFSPGQDGGHQCRNRDDTTRHVINSFPSLV